MKLNKTSLKAITSEKTDDHIRGEISEHHSRILSGTPVAISATFVANKKVDRGVFF